MTKATENILNEILKELNTEFCDKHIKANYYADKAERNTNKYYAKLDRESASMLRLEANGIQRAMEIIKAYKA